MLENKRCDALHTHSECPRASVEKRGRTHTSRRRWRRDGVVFMDNGMDALIIYDELSKHAVEYRQVSWS